jgi:hypothetical protein
MLRDDMDYGDRFRMTVKHYGREVVIELNRGKATVSDDERTVTIQYRDSDVRGPRKKSK